MMFLIFLMMIGFVKSSSLYQDFLVMGDWGGLPVWPYEDPAETHIAEQMNDIAASTGAGFALALGDNFYYNGVTSVEDKRFKQTFEDVFKGDHLKSRNFFRVLAGNHDHYGNCSAEIAYSNVSSRWHFPDYYYDFQEIIGNHSVHFVMIDTVLLSGDSKDQITGEDLTGDMYTGPASEQDANEQWSWINTTLQNSKADFLIVAGHFPVWSICEHGPTSLLVEKLKPMLEQNRVSAYLAGHDHCAQHIDEGKGVSYHGIGAGVVSDPSTKHKDAIPEGSLVWHHDNNYFGALKGAFGHITVTKAGLVVNHVDSTGKVLYTAPALSSRN